MKRKIDFGAVFGLTTWIALSVYAFLALFRIV